MSKILTQLPGTFASRGVGFDRMFDLFDNMSTHTTYPPYNIFESTDSEDETSRYVIEIAIAGFSPDNISIVQDDNRLTISGDKDNESRKYLHQGISSRAFKRDFVLAEHMIVEGASFKDGILSINCTREIPEEKKAREIKIS